MVLKLRYAQESVTNERNERTNKPEAKYLPPLPPSPPQGSWRADDGPM